MSPLAFRGQLRNSPALPANGWRCAAGRPLRDGLGQSHERLLPGGIAITGIQARRHHRIVGQPHQIPVACRIRWFSSGKKESSSSREMAESPGHA